MRVSELSGVALDWAVSKCEGLTPTDLWIIGPPYTRAPYLQLNRSDLENDDVYSPSTSWEQAGPIIEENHIAISYHPNPFSPGCLPWAATFRVHTGRATTPLLAAMRCYVACKLGEDVDVPKELL